MTDLVPLSRSGAESETPAVLSDMGFGGAMPAAPIARAWLFSGGAGRAGGQVGRRAGGRAGGQAGGGTRLRAAFWAPNLWTSRPRGTILLLPGRTEYIEKYLRVIARLTAMGFAVATLDWRGQGMSARRAPDILGHVEDFAEYQRDVEAFLDWPPVRAAAGPTIMLCHSMGGAIGLRALLDGRLTVDAAIFSAPFWGLSIGAAALRMVRGAVALGFGMRAVPGGAGACATETYVLRQPFETNVLTSDPEHFAWFKAQAEAHPDITLGAPTLAWLSAACRELKALAALPAPATPSLVLLGTEEAVVSAAAVTDRVAKSPGAALTMLPGARHEGLMESPAGDPGKLAWAALDGFLRGRGI